MSKYIIQGETLTDIANAIREKTGSTEQLTPAEMADAVSDIPVGNVDFKGLIEKTIESVVLPEGLTSIGDYAFYHCEQMTIESIPESITSIGNYAFRDCRKLAFTSLPGGVTHIGDTTFYGCRNLSLTSLPEGLKSVGYVAFAYCTGLTTITFKGTPESIAADAFNNCTNLTTINVPWAEGAVANAPWGATNATINYNYTGE